MKRTNKRKRMSAFLAAMLLAVLCFCRTAAAAEADGRAGMDPERLVTLTVDLEERKNCATIYLYRVGQWDGSAGAYRLTKEFSQSGAELGAFTTAEMLKASQILEQYAREHEKEAISHQTTTDGIASFPDLAHGLYLICQEREASDNVTITPFLTALPVMDTVTHVWNYEVRAYPKHEPDQPKPTDPDEPTKPDPTDPDKPTKPEPSEPDKPTKPNPTDPDRPDRPDKPDPTDPAPSEPGQPTPGDGGNPPDEPVPLNELVNSIIPLSGLERMLDQIEDMLTPLAVLPRTGDGSVSCGSLIVILAVSGGVILCLVYRRRKKKQN
ncbi:MAG: pilin N-terminal domain-containing protein [Lachnospiraceae bacterium]|nr:pilin N-terminal domain-containing protein [Lachnospiraceae bacterium]